MGTTIPSTESKSDEKSSFGSGLGADFKPLGKRIVVPKGRDAKPAKIKRRKAEDQRER